MPDCTEAAAEIGVHNLELFRKAYAILALQPVPEEVAAWSQKMGTSIRQVQTVLRPSRKNVGVYKNLSKLI